MINLRRLRIFLLPASWHILRQPHIRVKYPHLTLGVMFMIILIAILIALPASANSQPAYLTTHSGSLLAAPSLAPTRLAADPAMESHPLNAEPVFLLPVTGK